MKVFFFVVEFKCFEKGIFSASESEVSRSSALSSKDSKKTKDNKSRTPTKSADLNVEDNFDGGFKVSQSMFLPELKSGIDE